MFKVVFIIFSKPTGKYLCKSLCVGVSFSYSNLYFEFFYKLFQAATLQQKDSSKGSCKFWKFFEISYRTPKCKYFWSFRSLWDLTSALKKLFLLFHWDSCPCAALRKLHTREVGTGTQDPRTQEFTVCLWGGTLRWDAGSGHYGRTLRSDPTWDPQVES